MKWRHCCLVHKHSHHKSADVHFACLIICCKNGPKQTFIERWRESFTFTSKKKPSGSPKVPFSVSFPLNLVYWRWCHFVLSAVSSQRNDWVPLRSDCPQCCWACGFPTKWPQRCQRRESPRAHQNRSVLQGHCGLLTSVATNRQTPKTLLRNQSERKGRKKNPCWMKQFA